MKKIIFKNGTLVSKAKVTIDNIIHEVEPEEYEGETPLSAEVLNQMQDNIEEAIEKNITTGEEFKTNWFVDGKQVYGSRFAFTTPSTLNIFTTIFTIPDLSEVLQLTLWAKRSTGGAYPIPHSYNGEDSHAYVNYGDNTINVKVSYDYLAGLSGKGLVFYIKNQ